MASVVIRFIQIQCIFLSLIIGAQSCKSQKTEPGVSHKMTVLLKDDTSISELTVLESFQVVDKKRISKSQNLWLITVVSKETEKEKIISRFRSDSTVLKVRATEDNEQERQNLKNNKKGSSTPIKNN